MKYYNSYRFAFYFICLAIILPVISKANIWKINKDHSEIKFSIPYLSLTEVSGRFSHFGGKAKFNNLVPEKISLWIASDSIYTGRSLRDGHLKSNEFLKVKKFPFIHFKSKEIKVLARNEFEVLGEMTIKDTSKDVVFKMSLSDMIEDTWGKTSRFVNFSSMINRKKFDLTWDKTLRENKFLVGEEIKVFGTIQIQPNGEVTNGSNHMIPDTEYQRKREAYNRGEQPDDLYIAPRFPETSNDRKTKFLSSSKNTKNNRNSISDSNKYESMLWWGSYFLIIVIGIICIPLARLYLAQKYFSQSSDLFYLNISIFLVIIIFVFSLNIIFFLR